MATFKDLALQYVLSDDEPAQLEIVKKAAQEIESSGANRTVVGNWAASVQPWMSRDQPGDEDLVEDGEDVGNGDIISRSKALAFLAGTLEALDKSLLRTDQVTFLVGFFGSMFSYDHKSGITASTQALQQLQVMKAFKPSLGVKMVEDLLKLKEDFRLQTAATRLEIYKLLSTLLHDESVSSELQHKYGASCGFVVDLLQLCQHERDPRNLMVWFKIQADLLRDYSPSPEVTEEIFKAFSAYFPISLRSSATPIGITAQDLKLAVRQCFSAHHRLASHAFSFLLQKLDQGDAVTVAVKVDILQTIEACITNYENPQVSVVPYIEKLWNSLKYEVRNGEVKETIDATLDVLRAIANRLDGSKTQKQDVSLLRDYIDLVFKDCREDLGNPTYTKQAGLLVTTVITSNIRSYMLESSNLIECLRKNLVSPKSPAHTKDLVLLLNSVLTARSHLIEKRKEGHPADQEDLKGELKSHSANTVYDMLSGVWVSIPNKSDCLLDPDENKQTIELLKQVIKGLALLATQVIVREQGDIALLCSEKILSSISGHLIHILVLRLPLAYRDPSYVGKTENSYTLEEEAQTALRDVVGVYLPAYEDFVQRATDEILGYNWGEAHGRTVFGLIELKNLLSRLAYVGCSRLPINIPSDVANPKPFSALNHLVTFLAAAIDLLPLVLVKPDEDDITEQKEQWANLYVLSAIHSGLLFFHRECVAKYTAEALLADRSVGGNWVEELDRLPNNWLQLLRSDEMTDVAPDQMAVDGPSVFGRYLRFGMFLTKYLYRQAVTGASLIWTESMIEQVGDIATAVVRRLTEEEQVSHKLAREAFELFNGRTSSAEHTLLLTRGILTGLWPAAMSELYTPDGPAEKYLCNVPVFAISTMHQIEIHASISLILTDRYKGGPSTADPEYQVIKRVLHFWGEKLKEACASADMKPQSMELLSFLAMKVFTGAAARQDKHARQLAQVLEEALVNDNANADILARATGILVEHSYVLSAENHAIVGRLYHQWVYNFIASPLLQRGLPGGGSPAAAKRFRTAALCIISGSSFGVFEADLQQVVRLVIVALNDEDEPTPAAAEQFTTPLQVLHDIINEDPDSLKGHIKPIIDGLLKAHRWGYRTVAKAGLDKTPTKVLLASKIALDVLGQLPLKFEHRHLLAYIPKVERIMAETCGHPSRQIRGVAREVRARWLKIN
ncbi:MMS19 nucleotide excision repair protein [Echria macrotheca]|uniref:MMS19 nucleotide excision repair protein n=1 Tax=Echria macrotheca TaxID=438768 RepID=A0AAJ0BHT4_9PEZI|nr:MMS19 nucleotide excision repair protein [Echria macrotheca]